MKNKIKYFKKFVITLIPICFGTYWALYLMKDISINEFNEIYLKLWERGLSGIFLVVFMLCMIELVVLDEFNLFYQKTYKTIVTRIGYKSFIRNSIMRIFCKSLLYSLVIHISIIILLNCFHSFDFMLNMEDLEHIYFSNNVYINLSVFVCLSSIGTGIFFSSLYPLYLSIKNKYVFRMIPIIVLFGTIIFSSIYGQAIRILFGNTVLSSTLSLSCLPTSLIEPGCGWYQYAMYDFLLGTIIYVLFWIIGMKIVKVKGIVYDW